MASNSSLLREVVQREDGGHRANWNASAAVDAFDGIDVKLRHVGKVRLILARMDAVHRAHIDARCVFGADAGFCDDIRHKSILLWARSCGVRGSHVSCATGGSFVTRREERVGDTKLGKEVFYIELFLSRAKKIFVCGTKGF